MKMKIELLITILMMCTIMFSGVSLAQTEPYTETVTTVPAESAPSWIIEEADEYISSIVGEGYFNDNFLFDSSASYIPSEKDPSSYVVNYKYFLGESIFNVRVRLDAGGNVVSYRGPDKPYEFNIGKEEAIEIAREAGLREITTTQSKGETTWTTSSIEAELIYGGSGQIIDNFIIYENYVWNVWSDMGEEGGIEAALIDIETGEILGIKTFENLELRVSSVGVTYDVRVLEELNETKVVSVLVETSSGSLATSGQITSTLSSTEFELENQFFEDGRFTGNITREGFDKLINNADVKLIYLNDVVVLESEDVNSNRILVSGAGVEYESKILNILDGSKWAPVIVKTNLKNETVVDMIISDLGEDELKLDGMFVGGRGFYGNITKEGLDKLITNSNVKSIYLEGISHIVNNNQEIGGGSIEEEKVTEEKKSLFRKITQFIKSILKSLF